MTSMIIWSKTRSGNKETYHIKAICHDGYICNPNANHLTAGNSQSNYARVGKRWYELPKTLSEAGNLPVCQRCTNQFACAASKTEGGLIALHQKDLTPEDD